MRKEQEGEEKTGREGVEEEEEEEERRPGRSVRRRPGANFGSTTPASPDSGADACWQVKSETFWDVSKTTAGIFLNSPIQLPL